ncbi:enoyl-hydratase isomerase family [Cordyceps militaris]|uniref:Enoyl-hydratase isomerase family n=1 Tax=Cordyceps militaris TaxID=73501 RepID=A0A2H4SVX9_CORMI|nr:enoyl-hydratase isomerase family [Cordyceps militaris]
MESNTVLYEPTDEGITTITINRPSVRNAVNHATSLQLAAAFERFESDSTQKVCILTGAGTDFCAGYDLHEVARSSTDGPLAARPVDALNGAPGPMGPSRMQLSKPVIAAVSGHAVAGGLELALLADLRVADATAVFGVFCRRFGVPLIDGGTVRLARVVGHGRALDMILTGRPVAAPEALAWGLANRVVDGGALEAARALARELLGFPQLCMRADLASARYAAYEARGIQDALRFEFENGARVVALESVQGAQRFDRGVGRGGKFDKAKL